MKTVPLKCVAEVIPGQSPSSEDVVPLNGGLPFIQGNAEFGARSPRPIYECDRSPKQARAGDVLISVRAPVGRINVADRGIGIGRGVAAIRPFGVDAGYLKFALMHLVSELSSWAAGSTFEAVTADDLRRLHVPDHPSDGGRWIADFLDEQVARIDNIIAARARQVGLLEPLWLDALERAFPVGAAGLVRLGRLASVQSGLTLNERLQRAAGSSTAVSYLTVANVKEGYLELANVKEVLATSDQISRHRLRRGDVLMTEGGDLDKLGRGTVWEGQIDLCLHQNHVFAVRPDLDVLDPWYLTLMTQSMRVRNYFMLTASKSTNLASTSASKVLGLPVQWVGISEQRVTAANLLARRQEVQSARNDLARSIALLVEYKQSLITAAVTGEIDVTTASGRGIPA